MTTYFSTFFTGFSEIIETELTKCLKNIKLILSVDGLIIYQTSSSITEIKQLKFLNNSYVLVKKFDQVSESSIPNMIKTLLVDENFAEIISTTWPKSKQKFRIRASVENHFVAINKTLLANFETIITQKVGNFEVNRSLPDVEFLIMVRSEGFGLIGGQFTKRPNYEKTLLKGELYPELAYLLCLISEPAKEDIFLDPFAGHGSLPIQRTFLPYTKIIAGDSDSQLILLLTEKAINHNLKIEVKKLDALNLTGIPANSIAKIGTDPPWGFYQNQKLDLPDFYHKMLEEFSRITKPDGIIVILTAQKEVIENLIKKFSGRLNLVKKYPTLVSGKKVGVYKITKI